MNEEIRKNEISEDELDFVSGGAQGFTGQKTCPKCGGLMLAHATRVNGAPVLAFYACSSCTYKE